MAESYRYRRLYESKDPLVAALMREAIEQLELKEDREVAAHVALGLLSRLNNARTDLRSALRNFDTEG